MRDFNVISIHGAPRSGTSWLGKVFDSHPDVAYRFQPLFSYRFKNVISESSSTQEIEQFLEDLHAVENDEFILQLRQKKEGVHPESFIKTARSSALVMKEVRYHYLIRTLLERVSDIKIIGIVRHPCGVINSWLKTPREFSPQWNQLSEWRLAQSKNQYRKEEYYGFQKWLELATAFLDFSQQYPSSFRLVRYEELVENPLETVSDLFVFSGLSMHPQTEAFLVSSQAKEIEDPDTVFRLSDVAQRWKQELSPEIRDSILRETCDSRLQVFL